MQPPGLETSYETVVQISVTLGANGVWSLGQKDLRYLNVWCYNLACSNQVFQDNGIVVGSFSDSYNDLRDKPLGGAPVY